jgi:hypothetical protein
VTSPAKNPCFDPFIQGVIDRLYQPHSMKMAGAMPPSPCPDGSYEEKSWRLGVWFVMDREVREGTSKQ